MDASCIHIKQFADTKSPDTCGRGLSAKSLSWQLVLTDSHNKEVELILVFKERPRGTRKWSIVNIIITREPLMGNSLFYFILHQAYFCIEQV